MHKKGKTPIVKAQYDEESTDVLDVSTASQCSSLKHLDTVTHEEPANVMVTPSDEPPHDVAVNKSALETAPDTIPLKDTTGTTTDDAVATNPDILDTGPETQQHTSKQPSPSTSKQLPTDEISSRDIEAFNQLPIYLRSDSARLRFKIAMNLEENSKFMHSLNIRELPEEYTRLGYSHYARIKPTSRTIGSLPISNSIA